MIVKFWFVAAVLAAVQGDPMTRSSRQGTLNKYFLYTRAYRDAEEPIAMPNQKDFEDNPTLAFPELDATLQTVVIVHGHGGDSESTLNPVLKDSFFDKDANPDVQLNIIVVDWSAYTGQSYAEASAAVQSVGKALGDYLNLLRTQDRLLVEDSVISMHLIGFNLGAHVVGFAGRELDGQAARITGLDPSGNRWGSSSPRLNKDDARYVEIIHTDGSGLSANGIGTSIGDVDFFVNGGSNQPGCASHACSHRRAYELFAATLIREEPLYGFGCNNNLELTLNLCRLLPRLAVGGSELTKPRLQMTLKENPSQESDEADTPERPTTTESNAVPSMAPQTTVPSTASPTTAPPTTAPPTAPPTTAPLTTVPSTASPTTVPPTAPPPTAPPTTVPSTAPPTTVPSTAPPTTVPSTVPPTTALPTAPPTTVPSTAPPTTVPPTTAPPTAPLTTVPSTAPPTTVPSAAPPTTVPSTVPLTTALPTAPPTTVPSTAPPTTVPLTVPPTTAPPTAPLTTVPSTAPPTTAPPTTVSSTAPPTTVPSTAPPTTAPPTTVPSTVPPTTVPSTAPPTTAPPTTVPSTAPPITAPPTAPPVVGGGSPNIYRVNTGRRFPF